MWKSWSYWRIENRLNSRNYCWREIWGFNEISCVLFWQNCYQISEWFKQENDYLESWCYIWCKKCLKHIQLFRCDKQSNIIEIQSLTKPTVLPRKQLSEYYSNFQNKMFKSPKHLMIFCRRNRIVLTELFSG